MPFLGMLLGVMLLSACGEEEAACTEITWYQDADEDGLGNPNESRTACEQPDGYVANNNDTNDDGTGNTTSIASYGDALLAQVVNGDGNGIDNTFRNSGIVINEATNTYFAVNGIHPVNSGDYTSYYPKSIVEASLETDEIVNVWSFDNNTVGRHVDMEALSFAEGTDKLYIGDEYNFIYELDLTTGLVTREWDLADIGISTDADRGVEALSYMNGFFYAGVQGERKIFQLDLHLNATDPNDADYQKIETLSSFDVSNSPSGLFAATDGTLYLVSFGGGNVNQLITNYSTDGTLNCTITIGSEVDIQQMDGIFIDSNQEYVYLADSQGLLNGLSAVYRIPWATLNCE